MRVSESEEKIYARIVKMNEDSKRNERISNKLDKIREERKRASGKERQLVGVFKNGMVVFAECSAHEVSIYCQNFYTQDIFVIEKSFLIEKNRDSRVSALCSQTGEALKILIELQRGDHIEVPDYQSRVIFYTANVFEGSIVGEIDKKIVLLPPKVWPVDSQGQSFYSLGDFRYFDVTDGFFNIERPSAEKISYDFTGRTATTMELYPVENDLFCMGFYNKGFMNSAYLRLYDPKKFKGSDQGFIDVKISGAVQAVAVSPNRKYLAMSIKSGEYFFYEENYGRVKVQVNNYVLPIEIWSIEGTPRKLRTVDLKLFNTGMFSGQTKSGEFVFKSMAISNHGDVACAINSGMDSCVYFYSLSESKLCQSSKGVDLGRQGNRLGCEGFHPGIISEENSRFLFPVNNRFWYEFKLDEQTSSMVQEKYYCVDQIELSKPKSTTGTRSARRKPAAVSVSSESKDKAPVSGSSKDLKSKALTTGEAFSNWESVTITRGPIDYSAEKGAEDEVPVQVMASRRAAVSPRSTPALSPPRKEPGLIEIQDIQCEELLSETLAHKIHRATYQGMTVVFKVIKTAGDSAKNKSRIENEFNTLKSIDFPGIIKTYGYSFEKGNYGVVLYFYPRGDLSRYVYSQTEWQNLKPWLSVWMIQTCETLDFLHNTVRVIHKDIKPENIFLDENWHAVVGDFGTAFKLAPHQTHQSTESGRDGTLIFQAPELRRPLSEEEKYAYRFKCDVFNIGFMLWIIESGKMPYANLQGFLLFERLREISEKKIVDRETIPLSTAPRLAHLIRGCWNEDPKKRPEISQVLAEMKEIYKEKTGVDYPARNFRAPTPAAKK